MRSLELSQRRKVREQRKRDQELERVARLQREEEEKREAERKAKEVLAAQRREERRIARQVGVRSGAGGPEVKHLTVKKALISHHCDIGVMLLCTARCV